MSLRYRHVKILQKRNYSLVFYFYLLLYKNHHYLVYVINRLINCWLFEMFERLESWWLDLCDWVLFLLSDCHTIKMPCMFMGLLLINRLFIFLFIYCWLVQNWNKLLNILRVWFFIRVLVFVANVRLIYQIFDCNSKVYLWLLHYLLTLNYWWEVSLFLWFRHEDVWCAFK